MYLVYTNTHIQTNTHTRRKIRFWQLKCHSRQRKAESKFIESWLVLVREYVLVYAFWQKCWQLRQVRLSIKQFVCQFFDLKKILSTFFHHPIQMWNLEFHNRFCILQIIVWLMIYQSTNWLYEMPLSYSEEGEQLADKSPCAEIRARLKMCLLDSDCCKKVNNTKWKSKLFVTPTQIKLIGNRNNCSIFGIFRKKCCRVNVWNVMITRYPKNVINWNSHFLNASDRS